MDNKKGLKLTKDNLIVLLFAYVCGIFIWDYTVIYQVALIVMFLITLILHKGNIMKKSMLVYTNIGIILYFTFHTLLGRSVVSSLSTRYLVTICVNFVATLCILKILSSREKIVMLMKVCVWVSFLACIYTMIFDISNLFSGALGETVKKPFFNIEYSHNTIPLLGALSVFFLMYFNLGKIKFPFKKTLIIFFIVFSLLAGARRSFLFSLVGVTVYPLIFSEFGVLTKKELIKKIIRVLLVIAVIVGVFLLLLNNQFLYNIIGNRFEGFLNGLWGEGYTESSAISRDVMFVMAVKLFAEKPFVGYGLSSFSTLIHYGTWSHNNYLEILVSGGIWPLIIYYSFHIYAVIKLAKIKNDKMAGMFFTYMIFIFVNDAMAISYISRFPMFGLALVAAFIQCVDNEKKQAASKAQL